MIIVSNKPGYLANRIFLFSHLIAFAKEYNQTVLNPAFQDYAEYFEGSQKQLIPRYPNGRRWTLSLLGKNFIYNIINYTARIIRRLQIKNKLISITYLDWNDSLVLNRNFKPSKVHFLEGWTFRNQKLLIKYRADIVNFFSLVEPYREKVHSYIIQHRCENKILIGVHVRQGDFKEFEGGKYFYDTDTYTKLMQRVERLLQTKVKFIISTNNSELSEKNFKGLDVNMAPGHFVLDLYSLAGCDYILGPPSTYSAWASFFSNIPLYTISDPKEVFSLKDFKIMSS